MEQAIKNPLGVEKPGKLLVKFAVPSIIAMLVSALYNIVDQIFIGQSVGTVSYTHLARSAARSFLCMSAVSPAWLLLFADAK